MPPINTGLKTLETHCIADKMQHSMAETAIVLECEKKNACLLTCIHLMHALEFLTNKR